MLLGSTMLEIAIGMIFVYLLMSLLCSAFGELINSLFRFRARDLEKGIRRLLNDTPLPKGKSGGKPEGTTPEASVNLADEFFNHPLVRPLYEGRKPSYISSRTFSLALWNMATGAAKAAQEAKAAKAAQARGVVQPGGAGVKTVGDVVAGVEKNLPLLRDTIQGLPANVLPRGLKQSLIIHIDEAGQDFDKARANVEKWYDDAMDRVSGSFRRRAQYILLASGFALALAMNVDSFNIFRALWSNEDLRKTVVAAAEQYANQPLPPTPTPAPPADAAAPPAATPTPSPTPTADEQFDEARKRIKKIKGEINELGLPIGWDCAFPRLDAAAAAALGEANAKAAAGGDGKWVRCETLTPSNPRGAPATGLGWLFKLAGLFLTALAISQGAPFWFDLLNKFIVVRSTVKPQEKSQTQPSKDKPPPETEKKENLPDGRKQP
ncbi:MAG TPA: hypothetical protein VF586_01540 [Pyrinomonadaceae bacterium]